MPIPSDVYDYACGKFVSNALFDTNSLILSGRFICLPANFFKKRYLYIAFKFENFSQVSGFTPNL
jgi:hypothetical protein